MPKVGVVSLGCPKNLVDSEVMMGLLAQSGFELTPDPKQAQILLVNTCGFIEPAQQESIDTILELAEYKKSGEAKRLVVAGCMVERFREQLLSEIPEIDAVVGVNELERIVQACSENGTGEGSIEKSSATAPEPYLYHEFTPRVLATPRHTAYVKIAEGCDHPCTFCVIPKMRGGFRSRRYASVVREAENLARRGVREITLIGQDTTCYGEDLGLKNGLATLLGELADISDLAWVRFLYCYPNRLTDVLLETIARHERLTNYLDIPLQHASRDVLKRMRRGSNGEHFLKMIEKARKIIPGVTLRTSMIVGFPGETEKDFETLSDFVRAAEFDHLGVFLYSNEESSASHGLSDQVPGEIAAGRKDRLMEIQQEISRRKLARLVGQKLPLLVEGVSEETELLLEGRLASQAPQIDGKVLINDLEGDVEGGVDEEGPRAGQCRYVLIEESSDYDLVGKLLKERWARDPEIPTSPTTGPTPVENRLVQIQGAGEGAQNHAVSPL